MRVGTMGRAAKVKKRTRLKTSTTAGILAASMLFGVGAVAQTPDAGMKIKSWFESNILGRVSQAEVNQGLDGSIGSLEQELSAKMANATQQVSDERNAIEGQTISNIQDVKTGYIDEIIQQKILLSNQIDTRYLEIEKQVNDIMQQYILKSFDQVSQNTTTSVNASGVTEKGNLKSNLSAESERAQAELNSKISQTKAELTNLVISRQNETIQNLKDKFDEQIKVKRVVLEALIKRLVDAQKAELLDLAANQQQAAKAQLDATVSDIMK
jgi:hypothetical protein